MDHKEAMSRLRLARTTYVGPITCQLLMARYGTAVKALAAIPEISARGGRKLTPFPADKAREEWDKLYASGGQFMFRGTAEYPAALEHYVTMLLLSYRCADMPPFCSVKALPISAPEMHLLMSASLLNVLALKLVKVDLPLYRIWRAALMWQLIWVV